MLGIRRSWYFPSLMVALFTIIWAQKLFIGYFQHDELGYFSTLNQNFIYQLHSLFLPLNEHFQPLLKALHLLVYGFFGQNYLGIALVAFALWVFLIERLCRFLGVQAWMSIGLFLLWPLHTEVISWKAAGLPLVLSLGCFLGLCLNTRHLLNREKAWENRDWAEFLTWNFLVIFSSSLITFPFVYLVALFGVGAARQKLARLLSASLAMSVFYFFVRNVVLEIASPVLQSRSLKTVLFSMGNFMGTGLFRYETLANPLAIAVAFLLLNAVGLWCLRNKTESFGIFALGFAFVFLGTLQASLARGPLSCPLEGNRYWLFPLLGIALMLSCLEKALPKKIRPVFIFAFIIFGAYRVVQEWRAYPTEQVVQVRNQRAAFFADLEAALCEVFHTRTSERLAYGHARTVLPDYLMSDARVSTALDIRPPFNQVQYGFTLEYYARSLASSCYDARLIQFKTASALSESEKGLLQEMPAVAYFYRTYFLSPTN